jgi:aspartyl-tRNA(Asn)/glutamyl-tRNA(Gln) amidotransferase subunit A
MSQKAGLSMRALVARLIKNGDAMGNAWGNLSAIDLGHAIGKGTINPVELTEFFLNQIEANPANARIYARTSPLRARGEAMAAAARAKSGLRRGILDGVPISWKDNFDSAGIATEAGSGLLAHRTPSKDADVLRVATLGGLVCLGKTHMSELAFSGLGLNPMTATPPCINDAGAVPGGSSSGAAASVAFGLAPAAIGSDTGGSVRLPAAWNDLVGLKPRHGTLPMEGVVPLCRRFDTIGPIARTVTDCGAVWAALAGQKAPDLQGGTLQGLRMAILRSPALEEVRPSPAKGFEDAVQRLSRHGAQITEVDFSPITDALGLSGQLFTPEAYSIWRDVMESAPEKMFAPILARFRAGADVLATDYIAAWARLEEIRRDWAARFAGFDAVLLPTSPILPPNVQRLLQDPSYFAAENLLALRNTRVGNLMDLAAITLPTSQPSCGISMMAFDTARLLRVAFLAESALH